MGRGVASPNGQTPPTGWPVIAEASSAGSILALPPSTALAFLLSRREFPQVISRRLRSPILSDKVLAICAGLMFQSAESVIVVLLRVSSTMVTSGAFSARKEIGSASGREAVR